MMYIELPTPAGKDRVAIPRKIIIHAMGEYIDDNGTHYHAVDFLKHIGLSCHYMVTPSGSIIECADPATRIAWHAKGHNSDSIGIEILVPGLHNYTTFLETINFTDWCQAAQFNAVTELVRGLKSPGMRVLRHSDVDPDRKQDPGNGFMWENFINELE